MSSITNLGRLVVIHRTPTPQERLRSAAEQVNTLLTGRNHTGQPYPIRETSKPAGADSAPRLRLNDGQKPDNREVVMVGGRMYFHQYLVTTPPSPKHPPKDHWVDIGPAERFGV